MENLQYSKILRKNWDLIALITGLAIIIALIVSLVSPFQYSASTKILIIQKQEKNLDAYTATKSAEKIGKNLASIIFTSSFYNEVIESNNAISEKFSADSTERRKEWNKNIVANVQPESGILEIEVYDVDRNFAAQVVRTIAFVLVNKGSDYHGGGTDVQIKVVDDVFISKYPMRPNIAVNLLIALIIGLIVGGYYVILKEAGKVKNAREDMRYQSPRIRSAQNDQYLKYESDFSPIAENDEFGFAPEQGGSRKTKIITMHDHLK